VNRFARVLTTRGILKDNLDYHFIRASMVVVYVFFGYQKWLS
jgi:hypothetical protein